MLIVETFYMVGRKATAYVIDALPRGVDTGGTVVHADGRRWRIRGRETWLCGLEYDIGRPSVFLLEGDCAPPEVGDRLYPGDGLLATLEPPSRP